MSRTTVSNNQNHNSSMYGGLLCAFVVVVSAIIIQAHNHPLLSDYKSKTFASTKPYGTFSEFYPFYLSEHSQKITRQLHYVGTALCFIYILTKPILVLPLTAGALAAYCAIPFSRHLRSGIAEVVVFLMTYLIGGKLLTRSLKTTCTPLLLAYGFAWIGHFGFEHNKPAAFIYPTYSFMGDMHMIYDAIKG